MSRDKRTITARQRHLNIIIIMLGKYPELAGSGERSGGLKVVFAQKGRGGWRLLIFKCRTGEEELMVLPSKWDVLAPRSREKSKLRVLIVNYSH